ncbi:MAG: MFS transporter [bacterium]|nr:MFS transporter [bacterium]
MAASFKSNILKMYMVRLFSHMYFVSAVLVPFYIQWGGITFSQILFLNAWFMFLNFLFEIPTGTVADFLGRRISIVAGCVMAVAASLVYISYPHYAVFLAAEVIFALSYTLISGADEALVYDSLIETGETAASKKVFANLESFKLTGILIGAVGGSFIAKTLGVRMPMLLQTIPIGLACIIAMTLKEPEIHEKKPVLTFGAYKKLLTSGFKFFWGNKILKILTLDMVIVNAVSWIIIWFYQALLGNAGIDIVHFGIVHAALSIAQILIIKNFGRLETWLGSKKRLLFLSAFLTGIFFVILGITRSAPLVIIAVVFSAGFGLSRLPLFSSYMNKYIPSDKRATVLSTTSMLRTFSIVVGNTVSGILAAWSIPNTMLILGIVAIVFSFFSKIKEEHLID